MDVRSYFSVVSAFAAISDGLKGLLPQRTNSMELLPRPSCLQKALCHAASLSGGGSEVKLTSRLTTLLGLTLQKIRLRVTRPGRKDVFLLIFSHFQLTGL